MPNLLSAAELWSKSLNPIKDSVNSRTAWHALEAVSPITIEDDILIIGLSSSVFNLSSLLRQPETRIAIEKELSTNAGSPMTFRLIEGETLQDWQTLKQNEVKITALREAAYEQSARQDTVTQSWDVLYDEISRSYAQTPYRQLPQGKARYLVNAVYSISDAMDTLYPSDPDELVDRNLARVIDKVAMLADVPATLVALELDRLRTWKASQKQS